jgi:hypothetical protein
MFRNKYAVILGAFLLVQKPRFPLQFASLRLQIPLQSLAHLRQPQAGFGNRPLFQTARAAGC